jgi:Uma2 family endonuclease
MAMPRLSEIPERVVWTFSELEQLPYEGGRYEIIDGELIVTPMPVRSHQVISTELLVLFWAWCREHTEWSVLASGGVYVSETTWLEPDLTVTAVPQFAAIRWQEQPPPLLAIEIVSPSTASRDRLRKRPIYLTHGVREVWIVDGAARTIERWTSGAEQPVVERGLSVWAPDPSLPTLVIRHDDVFGPPQD